jgi:Tfp pilus assembly protein PilV
VALALLRAPALGSLALGVLVGVLALCSLQARTERAARCAHRGVVCACTWLAPLTRLAP